MPVKHFILNTNQPPGTIKYTGRHKSDKTTLELIEYNEKDFSRRFINSVEELPDNSDNILWLNITGLNNTSVIQKVCEHFKVHKMDIEDIVNVNERSKIEDKPGYLISLLKMVYVEKDIIVHEHISMLLFGNTLITFQERPGDVFDTVRQRLETSGGQIRKFGADYLHYSLVDNLTDQYFEVIHNVSEKFADAETSIIANNNNEIEKVYWLRKELLFLKNSINPLQFSIKGLIQNKSPLLGEHMLPYLNDVLESIYQIMDELMTYREMVNSLYETQISNSGNEMNKIMMTLTIFSAIFIPLSFLAGVFGMNFVSVPGLASRNAFIIFCAGCVTIAAGMLIYFKIRKWF